MSFWRTLRVRLLVSHVVAGAVGAAATLVVAGWLTRSIFEDRIQSYGRGRGGFGQRTATQIESLLGDSLNIAFAVGLGVAVVVAVLVGVLVGRRLIRPIDSVRSAADRMARGDYEHRVPVPAEEELAALATDMNTLGESLCTTEQRRTALISEVAHELRSPLTTINGYMEGLIDGVVEPTDEVFAAVAAETTRIQRLTEDLTLLSRAQEGTLPLERRPVDLAELVAADAERFRPQCVDAGVDLVVDALPGTTVSVDPLRIGQVLANLIGNALRHTPVGGTVTVTAGGHDAAAVVTVADTGSGIPVDELDRIFERFVRLPNADQPAGRGIGLTIARSIARAHGGDVTAANRTDGPGAVFTLTLDPDPGARFA